MTRYTLHVPLLLNDGTPTPDWALSYVERELIRAGGGFTYTDGVGGWRSDSGVLYHEPIRLYFLDYAGDMREQLDTARHLRDVAADVAQTLRQEAVYLTRQDVATELVTPEVAA